MLQFCSDAMARAFGTSPNVAGLTTRRRSLGHASRSTPSRNASNESQRRRRRSLRIRRQHKACGVSPREAKRKTGRARESGRQPNVTIRTRILIGPPSRKSSRCRPRPRALNSFAGRRNSETHNTNIRSKHTVATFFGWSALLLSVTKNSY